MDWFIDNLPTIFITLVAVSALVVLSDSFSGDAMSECYYYSQHASGCD